MNASRNLFVYGTLREAVDNQFARVLKSSADRVDSGEAQGRLFLVADYPGFVRSGYERDWVRGEVYRLRTPESTYLELDRYEGCGPLDPEPHEYRRVSIPVRLDSGRLVTADVYQYALDTSGLARIRSGDYLGAGRNLVKPGAPS